ncbi:MAG: hypothetical protein RIS47_2180 [Bacteroidota bacterium]|jgi:hypothetical protein
MHLQTQTPKHNRIQTHSPINIQSEKIIFRSGHKTFQISPAAGYPLVVLANGNRITWRPEYFNQATVQKAITSVCCGLPLLSGLGRAAFSKPTPLVLGASAAVGLRPCGSVAMTWPDKIRRRSFELSPRCLRFATWPQAKVKI